MRSFRYLRTSRGGLYKLSEALHGHSIYVNRYNKAVRSRERLHNKQTQRGRAIYKTEVITLFRRQMSARCIKVSEAGSLLQSMDTFTKQVWT